jgi:amino acid transporter
MGRINAFPHFLARVHPKHHSPVTAIWTAFVITVAVTLGLGLGYDPVTAFIMVATGLVIVIVAVYILMNAACIGYFARRGHGFNVFLHLIVPLLGIAVFVPAWLTAAGIEVFSFVAPLSAPYWYMGPGVGGFMLIGVIYLIYLYQRDPERVSQVGMVHLDLLDEESAAEGT